MKKYCKLVILGTSSMSDYAHPKRGYQLVGNFSVYQQAKNQLHPPHFSRHIAKIFKPILGTLGMPAYAHQKW